MTALHGLDRLESPGRWRPDAEQPWRDVHVVLGEASLVLQDGGGAALAHWSLPALERRGGGAEPARYGPGPGTAEAIEIDEPAMVDALDRVLAAVSRGRRRPGALRGTVLAAAAGLALLVAALWLPGAMRDHARHVMPPAQREAIGQVMLATLAGPGGAPCDAGAGPEALGSLHARILPAQPGALVVLRGLEPPALALPGGLLVLSEGALRADDDPNVAAGHALAAALGARARPPVADLLDALGPGSVARLLATGAVPPAAVARHARGLAIARPSPHDDTTLRAGFDAARLAWAPWAAATGRAEGAAPPSAMPPALGDAAWQALRGICDGQAAGAGRQGFAAIDGQLEARRRGREEPMPKGTPPPTMTREAHRAALEAAAGRAGTLEPAGDEHLLLRRPGAGTLLVTCDALEACRAREDGLPFGSTLAGARGWASLDVLSDGRTWFRCDALHDRVDALTDEGAFDGYDRVVFAGGGIGGYGAAALSLACPGATVLAIAPYATLARGAAPWERRFAGSRALPFSGRYADASRNVEAAARVFLVTDPGEHADAMHASLFRGDHVVRLPAPHGGPDLLARLERAGILDDLIVAAADGTLTPASFARAWRARRGDPGHATALLRAAERADRPLLAAIAARRMVAEGGGAPAARRLEAATSRLADRRRAAPA